MGHPLTLSALIRRKMLDYKMTPEQVALEVGFDKNSMYRIVNGKHVNLPTRTRVGLCRVLDIAPDVLNEAIRITLWRRRNGDAARGVALKTQDGARACARARFTARPVRRG